MPIEEQPQHREFNSTVRKLRAHLEVKIEGLPRLASHFNLSASAIEGLRVHLQEELDFLSNLPPDITLEEIDESYLEAFRRADSIQSSLVKKGRK